MKAERFYCPHIESRKGDTITLVHNFVKYWPTFKILAPTVNLQRQKQRRRQRWIVTKLTNSSNVFCWFVNLFKMLLSGLLASSLLLRWSVASSMTPWYIPIHTSIRRWLKSSVSYTFVWQTRFCVIPQFCRLRSMLFGGDKSGEVKAGISGSRRLIVSCAVALSC